jgi:metal-responsive CopG/Arc/MetJ family transcriptional regulator
MVHHVEGKQIGVLSMTYDHTKPGVVTSLLNVQHEFANKPLMNE